MENFVPSRWKLAALSHIAGLRPNRFTLFLAFLAVLGVVLVLLHEVTYGAALEWDSVTYIAVARNLLAGNGFFQSYDGTYYVHWPPLFPGLLALASLSMFDPHEVAGLVNAIAFGLTIFLAGRWLRGRIKSRFLVLWGCLAITLSASLLQNAGWVISEPVFILWTLLALVETEKFLDTDRRSSLVWSAIFTALACLTRYVGVTIVITVVLVLLFKSKRTRPVLGKVRYIAAYLVISVTPLGLWLLRNVLLSGTLTGYGRSHPPFSSFLEYGWQILDVLAGQTVPFLKPVPAGAATAAGIALLTLAIGVGMAFVRREAQTRPDGNAFVLFGAFALIYLAFLLAAASTTPVGLGARHVSPTYIPLLFIVALTLDKFLRSNRERKLLGTVADRPRARIVIGQRQRSVLVAVIASALALQLGGSIIATGRSIQTANSDGSVYNPWNVSNARFTDSAVLRYMREHPVAGWVYSNEPFAVYIHTDGLAKYTLLHEEEQELIRALRECASAPAGFQCDPPLHREHALIQTSEEQTTVDYDVHIVWLDDAYWRQPDYNSLDLRALPGVETMAELADGVVLRVTPGTVFDVDSYLANKAALITAPIEEAGQPILRSTYDVYVTDTELIYVKDACNEADTAALFSLHWAPVDTAHLADYWKEYGFNVRDFRLEEYGVKSGDRCVAAVRLPAYAISQIKTGQFVYGPDKELVWLWRESFRFDE